MIIILCTIHGERIDHLFENEMIHNIFYAQLSPTGGDDGGQKNPTDNVRAWKYYIITFNFVLLYRVIHQVLICSVFSLIKNV